MEPKLSSNLYITYTTDKYCADISVKIVILLELHIMLTSMIITGLPKEKTDKAGYEIAYKNKVSSYYKATDINAFVKLFDKEIQSFHSGGSTKGYVRRLSIQKIFDDCTKNTTRPENITILDAGSGLGNLSVYLAAHHFNVIGVEISEEGVRACNLLAQKFNLENQCRFLATSLENIPIPDHSIDYIIGHASLHHFIKYEGIPQEFKRIMKKGAKGYFSDSFGENILFRLFHDKNKMKELGDVLLTKKLIFEYFDQFQVRLYPTDWFVMLDKFYLKLFPHATQSLVRKLSRLHFNLDRKINGSNRISLFLSGAILTEITNPK